MKPEQWLRTVISFESEEVKNILELDKQPEERSYPDEEPSPKPDSLLQRRRSMRLSK